MLLLVAQTSNAELLLGTFGNYRYAHETGFYRMWIQGRQDCADAYEGGDLVWITSQEEMDYVLEVLVYPWTEPWIGYHKSGGVWVWSSGAESNYTDWNPGEPNGSCNMAGQCEECAQLRPSGGWNDFWCHEYRPFICKYPTTCNRIAHDDPDVCNGVGECIEQDRCKCGDGYQQTNNGQCVLCSPGSYCFNQTTTFCPTGEWSDPGAIYVEDCYLCHEHLACHEGVMTNCTLQSEAPRFPFYDGSIGRNSCNVCPQSYYLVYPQDPNLQTDCVVCPLGHECIGNGQVKRCTNHQYASRQGQASCSVCPVHSFTTPDNILCLPCKYPGEHCPDGNDRYTCDPGKYFDYDAKACTDCPPGYVCQNGYQFECPEGYYVYEMENRCISCPVGFHCPGDSKSYLCTEEHYANIVGLSECKICPGGYYTNNSGILCAECGTNAFCPDGVRMIVCSEGEYLSRSDATCYTCPEGFYCQNYERQACAAGYYANETGLTDCFKCSVGTAHSRVAQMSEQDCDLCPAGSYSFEEASSFCTLCPAGYWSNVTGSTRVEDCVPCIPGTFSTQLGAHNISTCIPCPSGSFNTEYASTSCEACPAGQYASSPGSTNCIDCRAGTYSDSDGSSRCILCPPGTYNELSGSSSSSACIHCTVGSSPYRGANSSDVCSSCEPGYRVDGSACTICKPGSYSIDYNKPSCTLCGEGTELPMEGGTSPGQCQACAPGSYASEPGTGNCTKCPRGTIGRDVHGSTSNSTCTQCPTGYYTSVEGSLECLPCGKGTFATEGSTQCTECPIGTYSNEVTVASCIPCPEGTYADTLGSTECKLCAAGAYNANISSISVHNCTKCPVGTFSTTPATTSPEHCIPCPIGTFCNAQGMSKPHLCPLGTYSTLEGSTSIGNCIGCPAGTYSSAEGASSSTTCQSCPLGKYGPFVGAVSEFQCVSCPYGTFSTVPQATDDSVCQLCPKGEYSPLPTMDCFKCPIGTYNNVEGAPNSTYCIPCESHEITPTSGSTSATACFSCSDGWYIDVITLKCAPCPAGTYFDPHAQPSHQRRSIASCIPCGQGYSQPEVAQVGFESCQPCSAGTFAPLEKNAECTPCGRGYYSNRTAAPSHDYCEPCPPGTWSEVPITNSSDVCLSCSPGTAQNISGASSPQYCKLCPVGTKSTQVGSFNCTPCSEGEQCLTVGSSFEVGLSRLNQESASIYDPNSIRSIIMDYYDTLKYSIPFGLIGLLLICACCCCSCFLITFRKQSARFFKKTDFFLSMAHPLKVGESYTKQPSVAGGFFSLLILVIFIGLFASILIDFIGNNKMVLESFVLQTTGNVAGRFEFVTLIAGRHKTCAANIRVTGFEITESEWNCEAGVHFQELGLPVEGCLCNYTCVHCLPLGNEHRVVYTFAKEHMMTQSVMFVVEVPHYTPGQYYSVNGTMSAGNSIFTGDALPHTFSFTMNNAKYVSASNLGSIYEVIGIKESSESTGYTVQLSGRSPGSTQPNNDDFVLQRGMQVVFEIDRAFGTVLAEEVFKQNLMTFLAQVLTVFSLLITIFTVFMKLSKRIIGLIRNRGTKQKSYTKYAPGIAQDEDDTNADKTLPDGDELLRDAETYDLSELSETGSVR